MGLRFSLNVLYFSGFLQVSFMLQVLKLVVLILLQTLTHGWPLGMNPILSWQQIGHPVLLVTQLHFEWKYIVKLVELMPAHQEVLGSTILVTGAWYDLYASDIIHTFLLFFIMELSVTLSICLLCSFFRTFNLGVFSDYLLISSAFFSELLISSVFTTQYYIWINARIIHTHFFSLSDMINQ